MKTKKMLWILIALVIIMIFLIGFIAINKNMNVGEVMQEVFVQQNADLTGKALECYNEGKLYTSDQVYGEICVEKSLDAGISCEKPNDCDSGICVLRNLQTQEYTCYEEKKLRGCVEAVLDGGVITRLCG